MVVTVKSEEQAQAVIQNETQEGLIFDRMERHEDTFLVFFTDPQSTDGLRRMAEIDEYAQRAAAAEAAADQVEVDRQGAYEALIGLGLTPGQASVTTGYYP